MYRNTDVITIKLPESSANHLVSKETGFRPICRSDYTVSVEDVINGVEVGCTASVMSIRASKICKHCLRRSYEIHPLHANECIILADAIKGVREAKESYNGSSSRTQIGFDDEESLGPALSNPFVNESDDKAEIEEVEEDDTNEVFRHMSLEEVDHELKNSVWLVLNMKTKKFSFVEGGFHCVVGELREQAIDLLENDIVHYVGELQEVLFVSAMRPEDFRSFRFEHCPVPVEEGIHLGQFLTHSSEEDEE